MAPCLARASSKGMCGCRCGCGGVAAFACVLFLLLLHSPCLSSADPIFGARVSHMTVPQGSDDPKLQVAYWPHKQGFVPPSLAPGQEAMVLTDGATGAKHLCIIPNISATPTANHEPEDGTPRGSLEGQSGGATWQRKGKGVEARDTRKTPEEILDAMRDMPCSYKMDGWWTYEFCYKHQIRQLHFEPAAQNKLMITMEFVLGLYDAAASREAQRKYEESLAGLSPEEKSSRKRYHVQVYNSGTPCDLTAEPRKTEVRFFCEEDSQQGDGQHGQREGEGEGDVVQHASFIKSLKEAPTCQYELHYISNLLCVHRDFKKAKKPANVINCYALQSEKEEGQSGKEEGAAEAAGAQAPARAASSSLPMEQGTAAKHGAAGKQEAAGEEGEGERVSGSKARKAATKSGTGGEEAREDEEAAREEEEQTREEEEEVTIEDAEVKALEEDLLQL